MITCCPLVFRTEKYSCHFPSLCFHDHSTNLYILVFFLFFILLEDSRTFLLTTTSTHVFCWLQENSAAAIFIRIAPVFASVSSSLISVELNNSGKFSGMYDFLCFCHSTFIGIVFLVFFLMWAIIKVRSFDSFLFLDS